MDDDGGGQPDRRGPRVALMGPCGAGKSTLTHALRDRGWDARMPAQEHSGVPDMWRKMLAPDLVVLLEAPNAVLRARRPSVSSRMLDAQRRRLAHAHAHADLLLDTSRSHPDQLLEQIERLLEQWDEAPPG